MRVSTALAANTSATVVGVFGHGYRCGVSTALAANTSATRLSIHLVIIDPVSTALAANTSATQCHSLAKKGVSCFNSLSG